MMVDSLSEITWNRLSSMEVKIKSIAKEDEQATQFLINNFLPTKNGNIILLNTNQFILGKISFIDLMITKLTPMPGFC